MAIDADADAAMYYMNKNYIFFKQNCVRVL